MHAYSTWLTSMLGYRQSQVYSGRLPGVIKYVVAADSGANKVENHKITKYSFTVKVQN